MKRILCLVTCTGAFGVFAAGTSIDGMDDIRLKGRLGERLDLMIRNHVIGTDTEYITAPFAEKTDRTFRWQTEFWGKYMHAAAPYLRYTGSRDLRDHIVRGLDRILASQEPCGYIGNYPDDIRCGEGWDVWGMKYTMMGLIHFHDAFRTDDPERARKAMEACRRLCDYVIAELGPNGRRGRAFVTTGQCAGQPSCSMLEPVMWLYNRTREKRYLDFAAHIVAQIDDPKLGPELIRLADVPVYLRQDPTKKTLVWTDVKHNRLKAYEMMSCYQGLIEYYEVTGRRDCLDAAVKAADSIIRDEINLAGGGASSEHWFNGARKQTRSYIHLQETCVTITWMRLCEKLLELTDDPKYADQFERTFYNAYLGALKRDGAEFAGYTPLSGARYHGQHHCHMHIDCCTANGPRGFLAFLRHFFVAKGECATFNHYASANVKGELKRGKVAFEMYSLYPKTGSARIVSHTEKLGVFPLRLRIPAWTKKATVKLNGKALEGVRPGGYFAVENEWKCGDVVEVEFDMTPVAHIQNRHVAFTRGPVLLARDTRFADGDLSETLPNCRGSRGIYSDGEEIAELRPVRSPSDDIWMTFAMPLYLGTHTENPDDGQLPQSVRFCDYASAGNEWTPTNVYRTWFPIVLSPADEIEE